MTALELREMSMAALAVPECPFARMVLRLVDEYEQLAQKWDTTNEGSA